MYISVQFFRDLGDYANNNRQSLWVDKERELGKGGFGVVLKGELKRQVRLLRLLLKICCLTVTMSLTEQ